MSNDTTTNQADKIAKLLAKAEGASTEAEATAFFEAAERLMLKWGIDSLMLQQHNGTAAKEDIEKRAFVWTGSSVHTTWMNDVMLMSAIAGHNNMHMLMSKERRTMYLVGFASDIDRAVQAFTTLVVQMNRFAAAEWKTVPGDEKAWMGQYDKRVWQRSFRDGFVDRIAARLREVRRDVHQEAAEQHGSGMELVLRDRKAQVDEFYDNLSKGTSRARGGRTNYGARSAGSAAASRADMGQTGVGRGPRAALGR